MAWPWQFLALSTKKKDDKKDDKKGDKKEGHEPVDIIVWENAWKPIYRAIPTDTMIPFPATAEEL